MKADQVSMMMDSEMSQQEMDRFIRHLKDNPHLKSCWNSYHLIGDSLRQKLPEFINTELHSRITAAIQNEPTYFLPQTASHKKSVAAPSRKKEVLGFALAASITAVAVIGVMQVSEHSDIQGQAATVAMVDGTQPTQSSSLQSVSTALAGRQENKDIVYASVTTDSGMIYTNAAYSQVEEAANLYDYLVNYNEYARTLSLQGEMYPAIQLVGYTP